VTLQQGANHVDVADSAALTRQRLALVVSPDRLPDTAPTGHCLRLLRFPEFLDGFFGKLIAFKKRLDATLGSLRNVFGRAGTADAIDAATEKLGEYRKSMIMLRELILNGDKTQFVCVTVPTGLAMAGASFVRTPSRIRALDLVSVGARR
jgi:anion-transporting  ArsA/GET3 family ATPase